MRSGGREDHDRAEKTGTHGALYESVNQVRLAAMPPARYLVVHRGAVLRAA
ncbi:MAG TPA: hypothetical protein VJ829_08915 [Candidatus Binatia bacterium]|nr:hypothetical protein [Candidatus Binatia bacterium]